MLIAIPWSSKYKSDTCSGPKHMHMTYFWLFGASGIGCCPVRNGTFQIQGKFNRHPHAFCQMSQKRSRQGLTRRSALSPAHCCGRLLYMHQLPFRGTELQDFPGSPEIAWCLADMTWLVDLGPHKWKLAFL